MGLWLVGCYRWTGVAVDGRGRNKARGGAAKGSCAMGEGLAATVAFRHGMEEAQAVGLAHGDGVLVAGGGSRRR